MASGRKEVRGLGVQDCGFRAKGLGLKVKGVGLRI